MTATVTGAPAYDRLEARFARLAKLGEAAQFLHWDRSTVMPDGGAASRAEQLATLSVVCHDMLTAPEVADLLDQAEADGVPLGPWQRANLREMRRRWIHAAAVDADLVEAFSRACSAGEAAWRKARPASDFKAALPTLETLLSLTRQIGAAKAERLGCGTYEALLDEWEPGGRAAVIDAVFDDLAVFLPGFIDDVLVRQARQPAIAPPEGPFPEALQTALAHRLMTALGFDFEHGRLDVSLHPFCGGTRDDVRITTRYDTDDFTKGLMGVLHETGHALYELGLPKDWRFQPVGSARGMALHESQSLLIEMQACRSRDFIGFAAPLMRDALNGTGSAWDADNLYRLYTRVQRSFIRVDADEATYPAHVILRYRLERAMIDGDLAPAELPGAWNDGMQTLLGIVPPDDRRGCLQDIHWYDGAWGYFPTYTLGAMMAAQFFDAARRAEPDVAPGLARGDFGPLIGWLRANVHGHGSSRTTDEVLAAATGRRLDPAVFKDHLRARYLD